MAETPRSIYLSTIWLLTEGGRAMSRQDGEGAIVGYATTSADMRALGFIPLDLIFCPTTVELPGGPACEWTTVGDVPKGPGLYAFTIGADNVLRVMYVGLTEELWMVTKGRLPSGDARPGQRYGRPRYAGVTRQRVNALIAPHAARGALVRHWVKPIADPPSDRAALRALLLDEEQALITQWALRRHGWNRG